MQGNRNDLVAFMNVGTRAPFHESRSAWTFPAGGQSRLAGLRLLTRVSSTQTAERLLQTVSPRFEEIEAGLNGHN